MDSRQNSSTKIKSHPVNKNHGTTQTLNKQYHNNIQKQTVFECVNNNGITKMQTNFGVGGINSLSKSPHESHDNLNRIIKKVNRVESIQQINSKFYKNISHLIEESLKQIDEYRSKIKNSLFEKLSNENSKELNEIKDKNLIKFPQRPNIPIELIGKSNEHHLTNLITNSDLNKSDEVNTLIGRYEITNSMYPTNDLFHLNQQQINKLNENISLEYFEKYSKYLNRLLEEYFNDIHYYEYLKIKINILSLSEQIKDFFKKLYQRYRIIIQIFIQQNLDQSILIASRSLWDKNYDQFLQHTFSKTNINIIIIVFFIYKQ